MHTEAYTAVLDKVLPVVVRVHGGHHPELKDILSRYETLRENLRTGASCKEVAAQIEELTDHFTLPADACEAYTKVYQALEALVGAVE